MTQESESIIAAEKSSTGSHAYPFTWGECWKQCIEYKVDDFKAEAEFFRDTLGFSTNAAGHEYSMFTSPDGAFYIGITCSSGDEQSTPANAVRLQFMIGNVLETSRELERRGIVFEQFPVQCEGSSPMYMGTFRTPHGIRMDLWGMASEAE